MSNTQNDKRVTYVDKGLVIVVKNPNGVRLVIGGTPFREARMVFSSDAFRLLRKHNPDVHFVERLH